MSVWYGTIGCGKERDVCKMSLFLRKIPFSMYRGDENKKIMFLK